MFLALPMSYRECSRIGFEPTTEEVAEECQLTCDQQRTPRDAVSGRAAETSREVHGAQSRADWCELMGFEPMESCASNELASEEHTSPHCFTEA